MTEANWYTDPLLVAEQRYHDGEGWTEHVVTSGQQWASPYQPPETAPPTSGRSVAPEPEPEPEPERDRHAAGVVRITAEPAPTGGSRKSRGSEYSPAYLDAAGGGWLWFCGSMLGLAGIMRMLDGVWALGYDGAVPEGLEGSVLGTDMDTYGLLFLAVGVVYLLASFLVLARSQIARWVGLLAAVLAVVSATAWMPYYPIWSMTHVVLAVLVIYALGRYGGRPADSRDS